MKEKSEAKKKEIQNGHLADEMGSTLVVAVDILWGHHTMEGRRRRNRTQASLPNFGKTR